jgi:mRNA interferase YafQ
MLESVLTNQFKKDYSLSQKRKKDMSKIETVMSLIINQIPLPSVYQNHLLHGGAYVGKSECHIQPDWLLVYRIDEITNRVVFYRAGTHSDLF